MPDENRSKGLSKDEIIAALGRLNDYLTEANVVGEICLSSAQRELPFSHEMHGLASEWLGDIGR